MEQLQKNLFTLPLDIILNNIIPFTYKKQEKKLLDDIESYYNNFDIIHNIYFYDYNETIMMNDLVKYCNNNIAPVYGIQDKYERILRRNYYLSRMPIGYIVEYIFSFFHSSLLKNKRRKIRFLWGLLTPIERTTFVNDSLLHLEN
jgi:hypothetical protein